MSIPPIVRTLTRKGTTEPALRRAHRPRFGDKRAQPKAYKGPRTSISFHVKSDGRNLAAIDASGCWRNRRRHIWEVHSSSAKVAELDEFRCSGIPFGKGLSLRLNTHFKFILGA